MLLLPFWIVRLSPLASVDQEKVVIRCCGRMLSGESRGQHKSHSSSELYSFDVMVCMKSVSLGKPRERAKKRCSCCRENRGLSHTHTQTSSSQSVASMNNNPAPQHDVSLTGAAPDQCTAVYQALLSDTCRISPVSKLTPDALLEKKTHVS